MQSCRQRFSGACIKAKDQARADCRGGSPFVGYSNAYNAASVHDPDAGAGLLQKLDSAKWHLWHGNAEQGLERLDEGYCLCDDPELRYEKRRKLVQHLSDMITYIDNNSHLIPNYGEKYRYGETIPTAFVESTVNEVVAKRMVKKQQMQWSRQGLTACYKREPPC